MTQRLRSSVTPEEGSRRLRVVALSDTHGLHGRVVVPEGDVIVHAGDSCGHGTLRELYEFLWWFGALPHRHKILIAGNHDWPFEKSPEPARQSCRANGITYLQDEAVTIDGVTFYGSPWQPEFCGWAFNLPRGWPLARVWAKIPEETNVLVTHGPPMGVRDRNPYGEAVGCADLRDRLAYLPNLTHHVFGHIHAGAGVASGEVTYVNASICNEAYEPVNPCTVLDVTIPARLRLGRGKSRARGSRRHLVARAPRSRLRHRQGHG